ncbi:hypothetical protein BJ165DRAFT_616672 [Panaeolus papilionaceus]|nr:hypothetical protein BJ165DRAFT_616672 [Panaeolus papilionaceus]
MANSSNFPPIEPIHSFRDDSSTYSIESRDGVVTQDQSMDTSMTTDSVRRDRVKEWLNSTEDQQDKMQRAAIDPVLQYISNDPKVAQLVYESSSFKKILKDFIKEGQEHAQAIREQVPNDIIQCENTTSISFSDATRPRLESDMKVKFKDATPLFTNNALKNFPSEDRLVTFSNYWEMHGGHERFLEWLDLTMLYTPQSVEAGSRCTIDIIFLGLAHILKLWKYDVVHIPELKVRSGPLVPVFSVAGDPPTKVILNGSVDYAIVTRFLGSETGNPTGKTQDLLDRLTISQDAITLFKNDTVQHKKYKLHILFVEAKKPPPTVTRQYIQDPIKWLRKHEGQAVAEAIAGYVFITPAPSSTVMKGSAQAQVPAISRYDIKGRGFFGFTMGTDRWGQLAFRNRGPQV